MSKIKLTGAEFLTYGGVKVYKSLTPYYIDSGKLKREKEELADHWSLKTRMEDDPIVKCTRIIYEEIS